MDPTIETLDETPVLGIRTPVRMTEIGVRIGELMPTLMAAAGPHAAGPVLARWHAWDGEQGEMELAVPVRAPAPGAGAVAPSTLPAGRALVVTHVGAYDTLAATWRALGAWMQSQGIEGRDAPWEEYVDDCATTPVEKLRTRIVFPIA